MSNETKQSQASAAPVLTDADIVRIWCECDLPSTENNFTTGPLPFARAIERHLAATPAKTEGV